MHVGQRAEKDCQLKLFSRRLLKDHLVRKGWEFERVYRGGKRLHGEGFTLICLPNQTKSSRLGISVHRKIRGAVKRNRIKRIIREAFRVEREQFPAGMDIVFAVRLNFTLENPGAICKAVGKLTAGFTCCHNL